MGKIFLVSSARYQIISASIRARIVRLYRVANSPKAGGARLITSIKAAPACGFREARYAVVAMVWPGWAMTCYRENRREPRVRLIVRREAHSIDGYLEVCRGISSRAEEQLRDGVDRRRQNEIFACSAAKGREAIFKRPANDERNRNISTINVIEEITVALKLLSRLAASCETR
jgi:hypothetical protein